MNAFLPLVAALAATTHPFTVDDMLDMQRISEAVVSPDGRSVVYTVRTTDLADNRGRTDLWLTLLDGKGTTRRLTSHPESDSSARFLADSRHVVFLSTRSGSSQVWRLAVDGGEAEQVTQLPPGIEVDGVLPIDSERLLLLIDVYPDAATLEESAQRDADKARNKSKVLAYDELLFRHWDHWEDGKRTHLFVYRAGTPPLDLMKGMDCDAPPPPHGELAQIALAPDHKTAVFTSRCVGREAAWSTNLDLFRVPLDGAQKPVSITADNPATDTNPIYSPDGKTIAYLAMARPTYEADRQRIVLYDVASGRRRVLAESWDRSASELVWSPDGKTLYTTADHVGNHALFAVDVSTGKVRTVVDKGHNHDVLVAGRQLVFARDTLRLPTELYRVGSDGSKLEAVTRINAERLGRIRFGDYEQFSFTGAHGDTVYGYVVKPADYVAGRKYPVAFLIHGGPQGSFDDHFHYRWNPEVYAGHGYGVVFIDFHGSTGYGQAFTDAIRDDWGGAPFEDLMKGLDAALAKYPFLDGGRATALGASYGGYQINWINGHTDRFKALVCHDGNLDEQMAYYDTEELWFPEWEHNGTPWDNPEAYSKHSPVRFVQNWKTPTLVIHGGKDYRVVETQGMGTFTALRRRGVPARFLYFPDENHWVLKPLNSKRWHEEVLSWIDRYTKTNP